MLCKAPKSGHIAVYCCWSQVLYRAEIWSRCRCFLSWGLELRVFAEFLIAAGVWALHAALWDPSVFLALHPSRHASLCLIWAYPFVSVCELSWDGLTPPCVSDETFVAFLLAFFLSFCLSPTPCPSLNEAFSHSKWKQTGQKKNHAPCAQFFLKKLAKRKTECRRRKGERRGVSLSSFHSDSHVQFCHSDKWVDFFVEGSRNSDCRLIKVNALFFAELLLTLWRDIQMSKPAVGNMTYCHNLFEIEISVWLWTYLWNLSCRSMGYMVRPLHFHTNPARARFTSPARSQTCF